MADKYVYTNASDGSVRWENPRTHAMWAFYPPGKAARGPDYAKDPVLAPSGPDVDYWRPSKTLWSGCLTHAHRVGTPQMQAPWVLLVTADTLEGVTQQAEWFDEDYDLEVRGRLPVPWVALVVAGLLLYAADKRSR